jgi:glucose-6-phosphate isomerase
VDRICAVTDSAKGVLREEALREGYTSFVVPDDIGGRYSVLTPVGLLPIAVAGIDIFEMLDGAQQKVEFSGQPEDWKQDAGLGAPELFAAVRNELYSRGKVIEVYEYYEPKLQFFAEWLKQLFGESEGKEGKGIFPAALQFTADLHSMGQYLQEGNQIFFETILHVEEPEKDIIVPDGAGELLAGRSMNEVNRAAMKGVTAAHLAVGIPVSRLDIPSLSPFVFGQMVYFFETACALSGYLLGVYPFNQPGVESYKEEMRKILKEGSAREAENGQNGK